MSPIIEKLKGIPIGKIISKELKVKGISQRKFAHSLSMHPQTLNAIIKGRRELTLEMSLNMERAFEFEEGTLLILQTFARIEDFKKQKESIGKPTPPNIRRIVFWDTDFDKIDWIKSKQSVIKRVLERGNEFEKREILDYYNIKSEKS